ncbi:MAG: redoxin domain-containing protein [Blastocatellia bacterium]|jgi:thiol-disulfide isomerase/thioredoxin|nr:redoxin domain-containing protein [Blastocatellia bacterium]MBK6427394.1 redoxin domain-containing protein [Blastocatellia bacterium]
MKQIALTLALAVGLAIAAPTSMAQAPAADERQAFLKAVRTEAPAERVAELRAFVAAHPDSGFIPEAKHRIMRGLIAAKAPSTDVVKAYDEAAAVSTDALDKAMIQNEVASELANRGEMLEKAAALASESLAALPADIDAEMRAAVQDSLGWALTRKGDVPAAVKNLKAADSLAPGSQEILYHLGVALEKSGESDAAIDAYVRSAAVYLGEDHSAEAPLKALWTKKNGSEKGLDVRLAEAREVSRNFVIFESRRFEQAAPAWQLLDLNGKSVKLSDFAGKVVVMDFWGTWCPPCRQELPKFQELYVKYKDNPGVAFLSMNWERPGEPAARVKLVTDFMAANKYTFPVVLDHDRVAAEAYKIPGFPTVFMIDGSGTIRYRNVGYENGVEQILEAQLTSMLAAKK